MDKALRYKWNDRKPSAKQHLCTAEGFSYCKVENGSKRVLTFSDTPHPDRAICTICERLHANGSKPQERKPAASDKESRKWRDPFLNTWEWKQVRYTALVRSKGRCECCGRGKDDGAVLQVDHIKPRRKRPDLALTLDNLQVLCSACNHGKGNWDETDWRA